MSEDSTLCLNFSFQDRFADAKAIPPMDEQQDYELTGFQESGGKTLLKFERKFNTCDPRDRLLKVNISLKQGAAYSDYHGKHFVLGLFLECQIYGQRK